ncbi:MAG: TIGR00303 family protein [Archaeoglobaceae archaeon]|nr:TIGR00303 family protein [Archaeoglobaceae archaeon]MCX8152177.1 TIGR00303 family protein [Archaeoglobaceae archaeon]MDW8013893.1 TIGR00303 family protein [Archaeoglobaceae archaeon]
MYEVVKGYDFTDLLRKNLVYLLVVGNTKTAEIPGITVAGANPELIKYTPPADAELLYYGRCLSIKGIPATPDGKPTPALISYAALKLTKIPFFVISSGLIVKPKIPFIDLQAPVGENIAEKRAMDEKDVEEVVERAKILGENFSKVCDALIVGESIPAGTTTAAAVLKSFGLDPAVSSSMPENPIELKKIVIEKALKRVRKSEPLEILSAVGDPVLAAVCGIALGSKKPVILAGGTQMVAASRLISSMGRAEIAIATTVYVARDKNANLKLASCPVIAADPMLGKSKYLGLRAYEEGFVKEGVGAGGLTLLCYARGFEVLNEVEKSYEEIVIKPISYRAHGDLSQR